MVPPRPKSIYIATESEILKGKSRGVGESSWYGTRSASCRERREKSRDLRRWHGLRRGANYRQKDLGRKKTKRDKRIERFRKGNKRNAVELKEVEEENLKARAPSNCHFLPVGSKGYATLMAGSADKVREKEARKGVFKRNRQRQEKKNVLRSREMHAKKNYENQKEKACLGDKDRPKISRSLNPEHGKE